MRWLLVLAACGCNDFPANGLFAAERDHDLVPARLAAHLREAVREYPATKIRGQLPLHPLW
jgi:hypothetical protein